MAFKPTDEQNECRAAFETGEDVVITALAGTGKTSTLKMCAEDHPQTRMTYVAFNRAIADEAKARFPANVTAKTMHSFAFGAVGRHFEHRLGGGRVTPARTAEILGLPAVFEFGTVTLRDRQLTRVVMDAVNRFCHSDAPEPGAWCIGSVNGLDTDEAHHALAQTLAPFVARAWADLSSANGKLRFTHDVYLKMYAMTDPTLPGEVVLADEWQDADPVIRQIVEGQRNHQIIQVGDAQQQIYAWRGAVNALAESDAPHKLALQKSFRFGPEIAAEANRALRLLKSPLRVEGYEEIDSRLAVLDDPDTVLCRTNAEAISRLMNAQVAGRRAGLVGGTDQVEYLARAAQDLANGQGTTHPELLAFKSWREVQEYVADSSSDAKDLATLVKLVDTHGPETLLAAVQRAVPERNADLLISTAHKAKGREWSRVLLADDFPHPFDPETGIAEDEVRLAYVALTRAQHFLDSRSLGWAADFAHAVGEPRVIVPATEVPDRPAAPEPEPSPFSSGLQVYLNPSNPDKMLIMRTKYDPSLVDAIKALPRRRFHSVLFDVEKVWEVDTSQEVLRIAERFFLRVDEAVRERFAPKPEPAVSLDALDAALAASGGPEKRVSFG